MATTIFVRAEHTPISQIKCEESARIFCNKSPILASLVTAFKGNKNKILQGFWSCLGHNHISSLLKGISENSNNDPFYVLDITTENRLLFTLSIKLYYDYIFPTALCSM